jgi:hypothetical protein
MGELPTWGPLELSPARGPLRGWGNRLQNLLLERKLLILDLYPCWLKAALGHCLLDFCHALYVAKETPTLEETVRQRYKRLLASWETKQVTFGVGERAANIFF